MMVACVDDASAYPLDVTPTKLLVRLQQMCGERVRTCNLHFVLGTMKAQPQTIIFGLPRVPAGPDELNQQPERL